MRDANTGMALTGWTLADTTLQLPSGGSVRQTTLYASANYFKTVGVPLARGRELQWHPEYMPQRPEQRRLFREFVHAAREHASNRQGADASAVALPERD